jgi:acetyl-CoA synthetase
MDAEDMLFLLHTSGTTGRPKGVIHTTGGYLTQVYWTTKWVFDIHDDDIFWCTSDIGWITGHSYACYGPMLNCATMLIYEGAPDYPAPDRWWEIIEKYRVTILYTAPTAIRMFARLGDEWPRKHDLSSLRLLGTVGEPIDREAWMWYFEVIGDGRCPITDTWWQTETGGTLIMSLPGIGPFIPTVAGRSFPGTKHEVVDEEGKIMPEGGGGYLVQVPPFAPGMLRGLYKADDKYRETYWSRYQNMYYFTSDGARKVAHGCIRATGRVDDVMKVAGHRLSTAELEDALNRHEAVVESAVVAKPHEIKGEAPVAYIVLQPGFEPSDDLVKDLIKHVDRTMGPIARPERIIFVDELPKTRSGKIMRRILKALLMNEPLGDTMTLLNPECVESLKQKVGYRG